MTTGMAKYKMFHSSSKKNQPPKNTTFFPNTVSQDNYPSLEPCPICVNSPVSCCCSHCLAPVIWPIHLSFPDFWAYNQLCSTSDSKMCEKRLEKFQFWPLLTSQAPFPHKSSVLQSWGEIEYCLLYLAGKFRGTRFMC